MNERHIGAVWLASHVLLGIAASITTVAAIVWLALVMVVTVALAIKERNRNGLVHIAIAYCAAYEVFWRAADLLPWQIGTYLGVPLLVFGLLFGRSGRNLVPGLVLMALITPSLIRTDLSRSIQDTLVFNWSGVMIIALSVMYFHRRLLLEANILWLMRAFAGPAVTLAIYSTVTTPELASIEFSLTANIKTTGFGSNQMATAFGLGIVVLALGFFMGRPVFGYAPCDFVVTAFLFFRALISFSRGGLFSAILATAAALAVILWAYFRNQDMGQTAKIRKLLLVPIIVPALAIVFFVADQLTGGMLALRYQGQTAGTLAGQRELTLAVLTSGRSEIVRTDVEMFWDHLLLGVGPGNSADLRPAYGYRSIAPHTEYTRLMSEHGMFGLFFAAAILVMPLLIVLNPRYPVVSRAVLAGLAVFSLTVMGHSATRLFATSFVYGVGWAIMIPNNTLARLAVRDPDLRKRLLSTLLPGGAAEETANVTTDPEGYRAGTTA